MGLNRMAGAGIDTFTKNCRRGPFSGSVIQSTGAPRRLEEYFLLTDPGILNRDETIHFIVWNLNSWGAILLCVEIGEGKSRLAPSCAGQITG
jgi:hypothetical protein